MNSYATDFLRWPITRPRSELKIASPSVCVHELAAVASATVATATLPYRHHHHRDHHHHHQTARKITWAHKGGQQLRPTRITQLRPPLLLLLHQVHSAFSLLCRLQEIFSRGLPDAKNTYLVCSEDYTSSKLVLFCFVCVYQNLITVVWVLLTVL